MVAGAGLAGFRTAEILRERGFAGPITLIGAESRPPYDRPPLSKKVLTEPDLDPSLKADFAALGVDFRPEEAATGLDDEAALVTTRGTYPFDHLVLATGALPVALPGDGRQRFLRTYDDALALRDLLRPGLRLAIVGAGWIGAELATAAVAHGSQVTVVEAGPAPLAAAIGAPVGAQTARWYADAGVDLRVAAAVEAVQPGGLALAGGEWIAADEIVTAVGVRPATRWLEGSGVRLENGVAVDAGLRSSRPGVYAVGDCAAFESRRFGRRLRFEHWDVALHAPEVVAANVLGGDEAYDPVPYFWSEQFGRMMQYVGYHGGAESLVWRGDPAEPTWAACWLAARTAGRDADRRPPPRPAPGPPPHRLRRPGRRRPPHRPRRPRQGRGPLTGPGRSARCRQVLHLLLGDVEPDSFVDRGHGTDRDGDFPPAPQMPLLEHHMGHLLVVRIDDESQHLPDFAVGGMDMLAGTQLCLAHRDDVVLDRARMVSQAGADGRAGGRTADSHAADVTEALDRLRVAVSAAVLVAFRQVDFLRGLELLEFREGTAQADVVGRHVDQLDRDEPVGP